MKIKIYRGTHQIGGCATEISTEKHRVIIDFGAKLSDSESGKGLTDEQLVEKVFQNGKPCEAVLFSHYHGDHIGLYRKIPEGIPLYLGKTAKKIMEQITERLDKLPDVTEKGLPRVQAVKPYYPAKPLLFGDIGITPYAEAFGETEAFAMYCDKLKMLQDGEVFQM